MFTPGKAFRKLNKSSEGRGHAGRAGKRGETGRARRSGCFRCIKGWQSKEDVAVEDAHEKTSCLKTALNPVMGNNEG